MYKTIRLIYCECCPVRQENFAKFKLLSWSLNCVSGQIVWDLNEDVNPTIWYAYNPVLHLNALDYNFAQE